MANYRPTHLYLHKLLEHPASDTEGELAQILEEIRVSERYAMACLNSPVQLEALPRMDSIGFGSVILVRNPQAPNGIDVRVVTKFYYHPSGALNGKIEADTIMVGGDLDDEKDHGKIIFGGGGELSISEVKVIGELSYEALMLFATHSALHQFGDHSGNRQYFDDIWGDNVHVKDVPLAQFQRS